MTSHPANALPPFGREVLAAILARGEGAGLEALAIETGMPAHQVGHVCAALEAGGWIDRHRNKRGRAWGCEVLRLPPGLARPPARDLPAQRRCLMCGNRFKSSGCGHRICNGCKATRAWKSGADFRTPDNRTRTPARGGAG